VTYPYESSILVLGRALHAPWNEGTRVIGRDIRRVACLVRPAQALSLTHASFHGGQGDEPHTEHLYTHAPYGALSDYTALRWVARAARSILDNRNFGAVHLVGLPLALAPWLRSRAPVVAHVVLAQHSYHSPVERLRAGLGWRCFDPWIDAYACSSRHVCEQLAARGYPEAKLHVVPPPIDVGRFRPADRAAARHALGLPADTFLVAYIGTISPLRFPAGLVLQALETAARHIPRLSLAVFAPVCTHPYNAIWADQQLRPASAGSPLPVSLQLRDLTEEQKITLYSAADVVLLPFAAPVAVEPPLTLLEAMSCGAAVAVAPAANRSQLIADQGNGVVFGSPEQLAQRLAQLHAGGASYRARLGAAARASVIEQHSFVAVARSLAALWGRIEHRSATRKDVICQKSVSR
jgi:glycosyltransferase involved in cell wall biosynthesis